MNALRLILPLLLLVVVQSLPMANLEPETSPTEAKLQAKIRHILTALGCPEIDIEKALQLVPFYGVYVWFAYFLDNVTERFQIIASVENNMSMKFNKYITHKYMHCFGFT